MTIKELCNNQECCKTCPFNDARKLLDCNVPFVFDKVDEAITRSIIETAKALQEDQNE